MPPFAEIAARSPFGEIVSLADDGVGLFLGDLTAWPAPKAGRAPGVNDSAVPLGGASGKKSSRRSSSHERNAP